MHIKLLAKKVFWKIPMSGKVRIFFQSKYEKFKLDNETDNTDFTCNADSDLLYQYTKYVLSIPTQKKNYYSDYQVHQNSHSACTLIAYFLTQFAPDKHNDKWWGKGTTEWNNVSKAVSQFVGHEQPKLPGEFGFYDLRIKDVMRRQIEVAKNYGIDVFSFYYYWFNDERILEEPLNMFLNDKTLDIKFMFCWANENWTRRFSGTSDDVLIGMDHTESNYKKFIDEVIPYFRDNRYYKIDSRFVLQIYRPDLIPSVSTVIEHWRKRVREELGAELYLIACQTGNIDWIKSGFDAENEWMQGSIKHQCKDITSRINTLRKDFGGMIYDYEDMVINRKYIIKRNRGRNVFPAVMPRWDNSARRNNKGTIWYGSTPDLYKKWLKDIIAENIERDLDDNIVFINAWNEWGEGAYLEPDRLSGFAYLEATWEAKKEAFGVK